MIGKLLRGASTALVYFCIATILSEAILLACLAATWRPDRSQLVQALAVLQGIDLLALHEETRSQQEPIPPEEASYEQIVEKRALAIRHIELREQALQNGLDQLRFDRDNLAKQREEYERLHEAFDEALLALREGKGAEGLAEVGVILENADPSQAKELLLQMLMRDEMDEVVLLLKNMENRKRSKILDEFVSRDEQQKLDEVLRRIREGAPEATLAEQTQQDLDQMKPEGT
jgi:hypothetical protein